MAARILAVENDANLQTMLQALFTRLGYSMDFAGDTALCMEKLHATASDAILLDLILAAGSGLDVLKRLESEKPEFLARVVVISAASEAMLDQARTYPVHAVVRKPFDIDHLVDTVRSCTAVVCI